ncbi:MAG: hypothetical protein ACKO2G_01835 [Verrucomicrobiales bacterium]
MKHVFHLLFATSCIALARADSHAVIAGNEDAARAAYPRPFSRPPSVGQDYDTWRDAKGPDIGETMVDPKRLPSRVDNSTRPEFPPIYKQYGGACGQFTAIASMLTYEMNVHGGTHADTEARRFPADFSWNMINSANKSNGSEAYHGWEVAKHIGIPTVQSYGTVHRKEAGPWPNGYQIWREAMEYRVAGYRYTPAQTVEQINEARGWLFDRNNPREGKESIGGLLALDGRMGELEKVTRTIAEGGHLAGEDVWIRWGPTGYGHGITCVGYDDNVGFDVNGDGKITNDIDTNGDGRVTLADWERGAYIVVNSWGEKWSKDGKIYLLYSAMIDPTWERGNYLGRIEVARQIPRRTLKLRLTCDNRADLRVKIGIARNKDAEQPEHEFAPQPLNGWPLFGERGQVGKVPLAGPGDSSPVEIGIDVTDLFGKLGPEAADEARLFVRFDRTKGSKMTGELQACAVRSYDANGGFVSEEVVEIENGTFGPETLKIATWIGQETTNLPTTPEPQ